MTWLQSQQPWLLLNNPLRSPPTVSQWTVVKLTHQSDKRPSATHTRTRLRDAPNIFAISLRGAGVCFCPHAISYLCSQGLQGSTGLAATLKHASAEKKVPQYMAI